MRRAVIGVDDEPVNETFVLQQPRRFGAYVYERKNGISLPSPRVETLSVGK